MTYFVRVCICDAATRILVFLEFSESNVNSDSE
jgi:hypothetical protein